MVYRKFIIGALLGFTAGLITSKFIDISYEDNTDVIKKHTISDDEKSDYIEYTATIRNIFVANDGTGDRVYIVDTNRHLFVFDFDNPELLLLEKKCKLLVYIPIKYHNSNVIKINYYKQFGSV